MHLFHISNGVSFMTTIVSILSKGNYRSNLLAKEDNSWGRIWVGNNLGGCFCFFSTSYLMYWCVTTSGHRCRVSSRARMFIFINSRLRISTQIKSKAVKLLSTLLSKYVWGWCSYEKLSKSKLSPRHEENRKGY